MLYILYVTFRGNNLFLAIAIASPILTTYTALEGLCRPFKKMSLNIFNFILLSSTSLMYGTVWYFIQSDQDEKMVISFALLYLFLTLCLIGVIILHFLWVTGSLDKLKNKRWTCLYIRPKQNEENMSRVDLSGSFFEPHGRVREPLLSSYHNRYH